MEIVLSPELREFVAHEVQSGNFTSPEEVIQSGLALLREKKLSELRREIMIGVEQADRGDTLPMTDELAKEILNEVMAELEAEDQKTP